MQEFTCTAPVNIAVVKYWGKRDENLILPINDSLSVTLDQQQLRSKTTVRLSNDFDVDRIWLNGKEQDINSSRLQNVLNQIRIRDSQKQKGCVHIISENNFPTAAGLASSASGLACLVFTLAKVYGIQGNISDIARMGSGSACRSLYGGYVEWQMGKEKSGTDSLAVQIADENHWPEMRVIVCVVSALKKHTGSTSGMQTSVQTSSLLKYRAESVVPERMKKMKSAILSKDFATFAIETMKDSNQMHACCLDTYPPISYMIDISREIIRIVNAVNNVNEEGSARVAYTFDAGPNACLYLPSSMVPQMISLLKYYFPSAEGQQFITGLPLTDDIPCPNKEILESLGDNKYEGGIQYLIHTKPGPGPLVLKNDESLMDNNGLPKDK